MIAQEGVELEVSCVPWKDGKRAKHPVLVDIGEPPRVRVWDPVGKIFTVCHHLSLASVRKIVTKARREGLT